MDRVVVARFVAELEQGFVTTDLGELSVVGEGALPSVFATTELASASIGVAGRAVARLAAGSGPAAPVEVDAVAASWWFRSTLVPDGWEIGPVWDAIAGDYECNDGWIRLHTNAPHHREAALRVLGCDDDRASVTAAVGGWAADELESAIVEDGGCAAAMREVEAWRTHPQGRSVASEPIVHRADGTTGPDLVIGEPGRPLRGLRVLDLTRVLAGPIATRFLSGLGADVIRVDPPDWDEPSIVPEVTRGKRCARLDLRSEPGRDQLAELLATAHVVVHGYRPGALARLGFDDEQRAAQAPGLVDVSLDAYGWTGPWAGRRGFDSLVQMSSGIAAEGMRSTGAQRPTPLPVQALDHATGHLMAAAVLHGLADRAASGRGSRWRTSLARVAAVLVDGPRTDPSTSIREPGPDDLEDDVELTSWGPARRLRPPVVVDGSPLRWERPATDLGSEPLPLRWVDA